MMCALALAATTVVTTWTNPSGAGFTTPDLCKKSAPATVPGPQPLMFACTPSTITTTTTVGAAVTVLVPVASAPAITLAGTPANPTTATGASITYTVAPAGTAVYCRLDKYTAIPCPNPFVLGATSDQALAIGSHEVDYYLSAAQATPTASYVWSVTASSSGGGVTPPPIVGAIPLYSGMNAGQTFASMTGHYVQLLGGQQSLSSVNETTGITGSGTIAGPAGATPMRFGKIKDPVAANNGRPVFLLAAKQSDGVTYDHLGRVEIGLDASAGAMQKSGVTYWIATEKYIPQSRMSQTGDTDSVWQIHNSTPTSTVFGPVAMMTQGGAVFPNPGMMIAVAWSSQSDPSVAGWNSQNFYPWASNNAGFPGNAATLGVTQTYGAFPFDTWTIDVCKYRGDPTGKTGLLQCWLTANGVTTQTVNLTGIQLGTAPQGYPTDYFKDGLDAESTGGGANGTWELRRSVNLYVDPTGDTYTEPQIRAQLQ